MDASTITAMAALAVAFVAFYGEVRSGNPAILSISSSDSNVRLRSLRQDARAKPLNLRTLSMPIPHRMLYHEDQSLM